MNRHDRPVENDRYFNRPIEVSDNHSRKRSGKRRRRRRGCSFFLIFIPIFIIGVMMYDSNTRLVTSEFELHFENLPRGFDGFRIVVLSDIHAAVFGNNNEELVRQVREANPDIIAITGDFVDNYGRLDRQQQLAVARSLVEKITPIAPVFYITGNHEWEDGLIWPLLEILREHDVYVLRNRFTRLYSGGDMIVLAGTDDPNGPADMMRPDELVQRIRQAEPDAFMVMLEHRNHNLQLYSELGVDLVISGHAHGGYIRLPFVGGLLGTQRDWFPEYSAGVYERDGTVMLVSRGIGNHLPIPRFLNNPEVVVAILRALD